MRKSGIFISGLLLLLFLGSATTAVATDFTVTKATNSDDGVCDGDCSLREAVAAANNDDTIVFNSNLVGQTFVLGGTEITITKRLTIDGFLNDPNVVFLSGSNTSRHFYLKAGGELTLKNMILVQGNGLGVNVPGLGGSIATEGGGKLVLDRVSIRGNTANTAGALYLVGDAVHNITNSSFTGNSAMFKQSQYNQAFVLTEYFSYLRRNADGGGFNFWVNVLNNGDPGNYRGMVCSFITSTEYQRRFSGVVSHSNSECGSQ